MINEDFLNDLFREEGLVFEHDDEMRVNANYYWVSSRTYSDTSLRIYAGAEKDGNLTNRYSVNDQSVSGILCIASEKLEDSTGITSDIQFVAYQNQEDITSDGYLYFGDNITTIRGVAEQINRQFEDAVVKNKLR